jgi:hypothetical protein
MEMAREAGFDSAPNGHVYHPDTVDEHPLDKYLEAFAAMVREEALTQPKQEPVAWSDYESNGIHHKPVAWMDADGNVSDNNDHNCFPIPLYTTSLLQPTWVGLTDEEALDCWPGLAMYADCVKFWENIEAKLKAKNEH